MRIYRYEMKDGGGPWFTRDGTSRELVNNTPIKFKDETLYGCPSLQDLFDYFREPSHKINLEDCEVRVYEIPEYDVIIVNKKEVVFPKSYQPLF